MKNIFMAILAFLVLSGCATQKTATESGYILDTLPPNPEVVFDDPDYAVIDPPDGYTYQFIINDVTDDMFKQYVQECKDGIFTRPHCDIDTSYQAYTEDGAYWISVSLYHPHKDMDSASYIYVDVREVQDKEG